MASLRIKQGATFLLTLQIADVNGAPIDLSTCTFASQLRTSTQQLVEALPVTPTSTLGQAVVLVQPADTAVWPPGILQGDIQITTSGATTISESFVVYVEKAITS